MIGNPLFMSMLIWGMAVSSILGLTLFRFLAFPTFLRFLGKFCRRPNFSWWFGWGHLFACLLLCNLAKIWTSPRALQLGNENTRCALLPTSARICWINIFALFGNKKSILSACWNANYWLPEFAYTSWVSTEYITFIWYNNVQMRLRHSPKCAW